MSYEWLMKVKLKDNRILKADYWERNSFRTASGPFHQHDLILIQSWKSNDIHYNVSVEISYPFLNFNGENIEL